MPSKVITPIVHRENGRVEIELMATFDGNLIGYYSDHSAAENALNDYVLGLAEQGLLDTPLGVAAAQALVAACAVRVPSADWGAYAHDSITQCACGADAAQLLHGVHDTRDIALCGRCYAAYQARPAIDPSGPGGPEPDDLPTGNDPAPGRAQCDPDDSTPPPWDRPDAGRAIARQWHRDRHRFLTVLRALDPDAWRPLAEAYCAYLMRVGRPAIDPSHVLHIWAKAVSGDIRLPARVHPLLERADASCESYMTARTERE